MGRRQSSSYTLGKIAKWEEMNYQLSLANDDSPQQNHPPMFLLHTLLWFKRAYVFNNVSIRTSRHGLAAVVEVAIPFELAIAGLVDHFTPTIVNEYLEI